MKANAVILPKEKPRGDAMDRLLEALMKLDPRKAWRITWEVMRDSRSDKQNNALWGCAYDFLEKETGNDPDHMHEYFCGEFFGWVEKNVFDRRKLKPKRTTTRDEYGNRDVISTLQFMQFYEFIQRRVAITVGLNVPDPDPNWKQRERELAEQELAQLEHAA